MDIHEYFGVLRRGWALVVLGLLVGIAGGVAANAIQPRTYAATSREILANSEATGDLTQSLQASDLAGGRIASYVLVATSGLVLQPVIDELKLNMTVQDLASHLTVVAPPSTLIVEITATADTPALAKSIANTVSAVFSDVIENQIENAVTPTVGATPTDPDAAAAAPATAPVRIVNIEHASLPTGPTSSNASLLLAVGAILGLALGLVGASLRETLDRRVRGRKDVAAVTEQPVLGQIRPDRAVKTGPMVMHTSPQSAIAESFRGLRTSVEHVRTRDAVNTFVITAMGPRQGASLVAANLALAIADTATTVVVVDANLQSPQQAEIFGVKPGPGLTDLLTTKTKLDSVITSGPSENIWVVPIGSRSAKSADLLASARMRAVITELGSRFDVVIIDTPAISTATDATVLGSFGAATLLVVAEGAATRPGLADALSALAAGGSTPAGIVLNQIPRGTRAPRPARAPRVTPVLHEARPVVEAAEPVVPPVEPVSRVEPPQRVEPVETPLAETPAEASVTTPAPALKNPPAAPAAPAPLEEKVLEIAPPAVESTSNRAAARAARVAAKAAARAAASRPQAPVSRFAPKPPDAVEAAAAAAAARRSWPAPIDSVPVLDPVDESSNPVIDVPRGDTGERVTLLTPQPGDPTPEELAEIVANQFKEDVVYEIPAETFGSFHLVDADAFAAIDNEPTILPPFKHTEPEMAPGVFFVNDIESPTTFSTPIIPAVPLTEENAAFVIDLLADEPVFDQPRFEDWARPSASDASDSSDDSDGEIETEPEFDASVYDLADASAAAEEPAAEQPVADEAEDDQPEYDDPEYDVPVFEVPQYEAPVYEVPQLHDAPVYLHPVVELTGEPVAARVAPADEAPTELAATEVAPVVEPVSEQTIPRAFVAPASWPVPHLIAEWPAAPELRAAEEEQPAEPERAAERAEPEPVVPAAAEQPVAAQPEPVIPEPVDEDTVHPPFLARVTQLPTRERLARESYVLKSRELERAAQERLRYEQERLEARIREQLEADRRQLAGQLDELLEDTVMIPRKLADGK